VMVTITLVISEPKLGLSILRRQNGVKDDAVTTAVWPSWRTSTWSQLVSAGDQHTLADRGAIRLHSLLYCCC